jgi:RNA polymerase sigma-54 factor
MIRQSQSVRQSQTLQQRLSPQQIQYIKLLQLPTLQLEQRIKQEIEANPVLELDDDSTLDQDLSASEPASDTGAEFGEQDVISSADDDSGIAEGAMKGDETGSESGDDAAAVDDSRDLDWDAYFRDDDSEYVPAYRSAQDDWKDIPKPYKTGLIERLEQQVELLDMDDRQQKLAAEIIGSVDPDGYLRRDLDAIIDAVAFGEGFIITNEEAEGVLNQIQRLEPPGIAARDLRECLTVQLEVMDSRTPARDLAMEILDKAWPYFKKKHYDKILRKLNITDDQLREANQVIMMLDPKPGESEEYLNPDQFIIPDFEVLYEESVDQSVSDEGDFVIRMHQRNMPQIRISRHYKDMWDSLASGKRGSGDDETRQFIREKMDSARWFIESIQQRRNTLMAVMKTIVALQEVFFRTGKGIRPMILKDVADRIGMDISTVSRVVNGKYVQTPYGVFELKYFFTEGVETESGDSVSNREIKNILVELVRKEDKMNPLSDQALAEALADKGYPVARRTISKYREHLGIPVARMRRGIG